MVTEWSKPSDGYGKHSGSNGKIMQICVFLLYSRLKLLTFFTHYYSSGPETADKYSMVLPCKVFFFFFWSAPRTLVTYRPGRVTEVNLQSPHGPNDSDNWLDGVTVDHCFVLLTFLFWITSFMDNSKETKAKKEYLLPLRERYT